MKKKHLVATLLAAGLFVSTLLTEKATVQAAEWGGEPIVVPEDIRIICEETAPEFGLEPEFLEAIIWKESRFQPDAVGGDCLGLMQVSATWHTDRLIKVGGTSFFDPRSNIRTGADLIRDLNLTYGNSVVAVMKYNGDSHALEDGYISDYAYSVFNITEQLKAEKQVATIIPAEY